MYSIPLPLRITKLFGNQSTHKRICSSFLCRNVLKWINFVTKNYSRSCRKWFFPVLKKIFNRFSNKSCIGDQVWQQEQLSLHSPGSSVFLHEKWLLLMPGSWCKLNLQKMLPDLVDPFCQLRETITPCRGYGILAALRLSYSSDIAWHRGSI